MLEAISSTAEGLLMLVFFAIMALCLLGFLVQVIRKKASFKKDAKLVYVILIALFFSGLTLAAIQGLFTITVG